MVAAETNKEDDGYDESKVQGNAKMQKQKMQKRTLKKSSNLNLLIFDDLCNLWKD